MSSRASAFAPSADRRNALDRAHIGDIEGALGTVRAFDTGPRVSTRRKLATLLAVLGPGIVVMVADNDAGTISVFAQAGQSHGMRLLWVLPALCPALYITQEMVVRLGAVTGVGHARLTLERFGKLWCGFSLGDLLVLNLATLVTEFIGVALALSYFGVTKYASVPVAAALLVAVTASGSFRRWERAMYLMIAADLALVPLALTAHPRPASVAAGMIPTLGGGSATSTLLLLVALVGTSIAPWQLFFQQSSVVDKRITPRWLAYDKHARPAADPLQRRAAARTTDQRALAQRGRRRRRRRRARALDAAHDHDRTTRCPDRDGAARHHRNAARRWGRARHQRPAKQATTTTHRPSCRGNGERGALRRSSWCTPRPRPGHGASHWRSCGATSC